ncbi:MAG: response regulator [Chloroflexota bacterium]
MNATGHILVIDDEPSLRKTLARILQRAGFEVTSAESAEQGIAFLETTKFDLVYMDIRMPGLAGLDALKLIHASNPSLPVILFTAQPDLNSAVEALRRGATDYLLKPLKPETIIERTRCVLALQQKEQRKREIQMQIEALQAELKSLEGSDEPQPAPAVQAASADRFLKRGALLLDLHTYRVTVGERAASLPPTSFDYLLVLARHAPHVVDYQTLAAEAQGYQAEAREAQELAKWHVHLIRQAIETDSRNPALLINVRGTGYRLVTE